MARRKNRPLQGQSPESEPSSANIPLDAYKSSNKSTHDADHHPKPARTILSLHLNQTLDHTPTTHMNTTPPTNLDQTPKLLRTLTLVLSVLTGASALPWVWMAIGEFGGFAWGLFGFELIVLLGCIMTALVALGKVQVGKAFPLALACLAGTLLVTAVFGLYVDARAVVGDNPGLAPWVMRTLKFRLLMILVLCLLGTLDVYRRDARSWGLVFKSILFLIPVVGAMGWIKLKGIPGTGASEPSPASMIIVLLGGLVLGIFVTISGHLLIRSYEIALPEPSPKKSPKKS